MLDLKRKDNLSMFKEKRTNLSTGSTTIIEKIKRQKTEEIERLLQQTPSQDRIRRLKKQIDKNKNKVDTLREKIQRMITNENYQTSVFFLYKYIEKSFEASQYLYPNPFKKVKFEKMNSGQLESIVNVNLIGSTNLWTLIRVANRAYETWQKGEMKINLERLRQKQAVITDKLNGEKNRVFFLRSRGLIEDLSHKVTSIDYEIAQMQNLDKQILSLNKDFEQHKTKLLELFKVNYRLSKNKEKVSKLSKELEREIQLIKSHELAYAKAAALDHKTRDQSHLIKQVLIKNETCPYCSDSVGENPHVDHIHPVKEGGLSVIENMVYCCQKCNIRKGSMGLIEILQTFGFDVYEVINKLRKMGKKI